MTHLRGPQGRQLLKGMEPFQKACFLFMELAPAALIRYGLALCVAVARCIVGPLFWGAAWLASLDGRSGDYGRGAGKRPPRGLNRRATAATGLGMTWDAIRGPHLALGWWQVRAERAGGGAVG